MIIISVLIKWIKIGGKNLILKTICFFILY